MLHEQNPFSLGFPTTDCALSDNSMLCWLAHCTHYSKDFAKRQTILLQRQLHRTDITLEYISSFQTQLANMIICDKTNRASSTSRVHVPASNCNMMQITPSLSMMHLQRSADCFDKIDEICILRICPM